MTPVPTVQPICGNGIVEFGEECEASSLIGIPGYYCDLGLCILKKDESVGIVIPTPNPTPVPTTAVQTPTPRATMTPVPTVQPVCGNGIVEFGEQCEPSSMMSNPGYHCDVSLCILVADGSFQY